jgi:hypothetical protein
MRSRSIGRKRFMGLRIAGLPDGVVSGARAR